MDKLGQSTNVIQGSLGVGKTHSTSQKVELSNPTRVVPSVGGSGRSVQVKLDSKSILARPLQCLNDVLPANALEERFVAKRLEGPETDGQTDPVETGVGHEHKVFLGNEGLVVFLHDLGHSISHVLAERELVDGGTGSAVGILFVQARNDEGFSDEPE